MRFIEPRELNFAGACIEQHRSKFEIGERLLCMSSATAGQRLGKRGEFVDWQTIWARVTALPYEIGLNFR